MMLSDSFEVCCQNCDATFRHDPKRTVGCLCDPDAPTWVGWLANGQILAMSLSSWEFYKIRSQEPTQ